MQGDNFSARGFGYHQVTVDGGKLNLVTCGDGPPLVLLHGWTLDHRIWRPQLEGLGAQYRLIMPDRRGFGQSTAPADLAGELADIDRIAAHFGWEKFHLLGMSQAGVIAVAYALSRPDKIRALVTLGAPLVGVVPGEDQIDRQRWGAMVRDGQIANVRSEWLEHCLMQGLQGGARQLVEDIVADYAGADLLANSILPAISADQLGGLDMPLLALAGAKDTAWRISVARFLANAAPAGSFGTVTDAGHLANLDNPERFNAQILEFLPLFDNF
jgi:pimeloyl-ACP methyl ester carboxylesterase